MVQGWKKLQSRAPWRDLGLRWIFKDKKEWTKKKKSSKTSPPFLFKKGLKALPPYTTAQPSNKSDIDCWVRGSVDSGANRNFLFFLLIILSALCVVFRDERIIQPTRDHFFWKGGVSGILHRYIYPTLATPAGAIIWFNIEQNLQFFCFFCFFLVSLVFVSLKMIDDITEMIWHGHHIIWNGSRDYLVILVDIREKIRDQCCIM